MTDTGKLDIRPLADPYTKAAKAGSTAMTEGRGFLAVGSIGLAIEAFRKALREQPDSIEALAGLAECYDRMGRHDLSQAKYEAALAIAPNNTTLLLTFAASLESQGRLAEANSLRAEAAETDRAEAAALAHMAPTMPELVPPALIPSQAKAPPVESPPSAAPVRASAVEAKPAPAPVQPALITPKLAPEAIRVAGLEPTAVPPAISTARLPVSVPSVSLVSRTDWTIETPAVPDLQAAPVSASVTVKLPPATPVRPEAKAVAAMSLPIQTAKAPEGASLPAQAPMLAVASAHSITVKLPPAAPAVTEMPRKALAEAPRIPVDPALEQAGPRLERLSLGEVALLTDPRSRWRTEAIRYTAISAPVRFVPLAQLQQRGGIRLLNAARHDGLAARTRLALNRQGWTRVTIGDAARIRQKSLVLYSTETEQAARRLAARYGFWIAKEARPGPLTILLGRDWAARQQRA